MSRYDLPTQIKKMCPTPGPEMQKKFDFFYRAYSYEANTKKHMTFEDPCESSQLNLKQEGAVTSPRQSGWMDVHNFIFKNDSRNFVFVINQLRKVLGNKEPIDQKVLRRNQTAQKKIARE